MHIECYDHIHFANKSISFSFLHQVLTNVVGAGVAQAGPTGSRSVINIDMPFPLFNFLHGSPGDYAWGSGGLDAVITQVRLLLFTFKILR